MPTRRQEKVARVVKRAVSFAIATDLSDPRITGIISVTRVEMAPDLRNAEVYLSFYADSPSAEKRAFEAIQNARRHIQSHVADEVQSKFCPVLHFHRDDRFKKTLDLMNLIDQAAEEYEHESDEAATGTPESPLLDDDQTREEL